MISRPAFSPADELQRCGEMLAKHWIVAVPPALASVLIVIVVFSTIVTLIGSALAGAFLGGDHATAGAGLGFGVGALLGSAGMLLGFAVLNVTQAVTMHASLEAFADRRPDLGASLRAVLPRLCDLTVSMIASFALLVVPLALCVVLIGVPLVIAVVYFSIYVQAAVVVGGEDGITAIRTSFRLARTHVQSTVVLAIGVVAVTVLGNVANGFAVHVPIVNLVAGFAIGGLTSAFVAMATARFYSVLRDAPPESLGGPPAAVPAGGPPTLVR